MKQLTRQQLAAMIDHTFLKAFGTPADIEQLCAEAREYGFAAVMIHPSELERCRDLLTGTDVKLGTVAGFPLGQNTSAVKDYETQDAIAKGAQEIDLVLNVRALQGGNTALVSAELAALAKTCHAANAISKVILETCYLTDEQKRTACRIAQDAGVDFVKTSTGFGSAGATLDDVKLMRAEVGEQMGVKAAGGIRILDDARTMIAAGANRLGASSGVALIQAFDEN